ncbi:MAG: hypothetical protein JWO12_2080 [Frankiales bacterium]|nr:hypothetical protein [Frankiales bacterium]
MTGLLRTAARVAVASAVVVGSVPLGGVVSAGDIRTDTKLAGFAVTVEASPLRVLLDDPNLAIPHDPGTAIVEGDPNYTLASVAAGPNARAVTSTVWPGNLFGEGLAQLPPPTSPVHPAYPIKGEARYPDKPYTAQGVDGGALSIAEAMGLDAHATADGTPTNKPGQVTVGDATSTSKATVTPKDEAVGDAFSAVKDVDLVAGVIHIGAVTTKIVTQSDGKKLVSSGTTTVSGLTIGGQAFTVDDKGLHAAGNGSALPALTAQALGISATLLNQKVVKTTNGVSRAAGGLVIDIDTGPLRKQLSPVTGVTNPILNGIIGNLPPDQQGNFYYLVKATPHITFVFAEANSSAAATQPLSFSFPGFGAPSFPTPGGGFSGSVAPGSPNPGAGAVITPGIADIPGGSAVVPRLADQGGGSPVLAPTTQAASTTGSGFAGIGAGPLLGAVAASGLIGWLLLRFLGLAGGALGVGCRLGAPTSVPNLRSVTA